jgi:hypothetical protein
MKKVCRLINPIALYIFTLLFLFFKSVQPLVAQVKITGVITDKMNLPLSYANVFIYGTYEGTVTDDSGRFVLTTKLSGTITLGVSHIGMQTSLRKIEIKDLNQDIDFRLKEDDTPLTPVVITAGTFTAGEQNKTELLKPRDIGTTAGTPGDIQSTIEKLPGTQKVGYTEGLFVRGGSDKESKYIMDGMILPNPYYSSVPGLKQQGRSDPFLFSGTIFSAGGYSAQYGQALSSVLILNSNGIADSTLTGGGIHLYGLTAFHTQRWQNTSLYINLNYNDLTPYYKSFNFITQNTTWASPPINKDIKIVLRHKPNENGLFKLYTDISTTQLGVSYNDPLKITKSNFDIKNFNSLINSNYTHCLNNGKTSIFAGVSASFNDDKMNYIGRDLNESEYLYQGKLLAKYNYSNNIRFITGGEYINTQLKGQADSLKSNVNEYLISFFAETEASIGKRIAFRIGLRSEQSSYSNKSTLVPRTSLAYKFSKCSQVSFSYGIFYQLPDKEIILSNPSGLNNQQAEHFIANYQFQKNDRTLRLEMYYKNYRNLVSDYIPQHNYPGHAGYAKGFEVFFRDKTTIDNLDYWISYSYIDSKRKTIIPGKFLTPDYVSTHTVSIVEKYWVPSIGIIISASYNHASKRCFNYLKENREPIKLDIPAYSSFDISISKPFVLFHRQSVMFCSLQNVFGYDKVIGYITIPTFTGPFHVYPAEKRSPFIGIFISMYNN